MTTDVLTLLKKDHKSMKKILVELTAKSAHANGKRSQLLSEIRTRMKIHQQLEEDIFYPAFKASGGDETVYFAAKLQHRELEEFVLPDLVASESNGDTFRKYLLQLYELMEQHAYEEETIMFQQARERLSKQQLQTLGRYMRVHKRKLVKEQLQKTDA